MKMTKSKQKRFLRKVPKTVASLTPESLIQEDWHSERPASSASGQHHEEDRPPQAEDEGCDLPLPEGGAVEAGQGRHDYES